MKKKTIRGNILLLLTAFIWGSAFVAQSVGMEYVGPFTFNFARNIIGGAFLIPCICLLNKLDPVRRPVYTNEEEKKKAQKTLLIGGLCCGVALFVASSLQQIGVQYTTAGKAGFITALYIIFVPVLGMFLKKKVHPTVWLAVGISAVGLYLLSIKENFSMGTGDIYVCLCALCFAIHILVIDHFSPLVDGVKMSCIQFFTAGMLSAAAAFLFEKPSANAVLQCWFPILYAAIFSSGIAYTLQIVAQKSVKPAAASLIMSMESVFAALCGAVILHERFTQRELIGCVLVFGAVLLAQLPDMRRAEKQN